MWVSQCLSQKLDKKQKGKEGRKTSKEQVPSERLRAVPQGTGSCSLSSNVSRKSRFSVILCNKSVLIRLVKDEHFC